MRTRRERERNRSERDNEVTSELYSTKKSLKIVSPQK